MPLQLSYTTKEMVFNTETQSLDITDNDVTYEECYVVIPSVLILKNSSTIFTTWFSNYASQTTNERPVNQKAYTVPSSYFDSGPVFQLAHEHLLTLPDFSGATIVQD